MLCNESTYWHSAYLPGMYSDATHHIGRGRIGHFHPNRTIPASGSFCVGALIQVAQVRRLADVESEEFPLEDKQLAVVVMREKRGCVRVLVACVHACVGTPDHILRCCIQEQPMNDPTTHPISHPASRRTIGEACWRDQTESLLTTLPVG